MKTIDILKRGRDLGLSDAEMAEAAGFKNTESIKRLWRVHARNETAEMSLDRGVALLRYIQRKERGGK